MDNMHDPREDTEEYGFTERELAFKLLASHAMVDEAFFQSLRNNPESAAAQLHIRLTERDLYYLTDVVEWDEIDKYSSDIRERLHLDQVTNSW